VVTYIHPWPIGCSWIPLDTEGASLFWCQPTTFELLSTIFRGILLRAFLYLDIPPNISELLKNPKRVFSNHLLWCAISRIPVMIILALYQRYI
jgi:hypothetical protein